MTLAELMQQRAKLAADMRSLHAACGDNEMTSEQRSSWESMKTEIKKVEDKIAREEEVRRLEQLHVQADAGAGSAGSATGNLSEGEQRGQAFSSFLRHGLSEMSEEQRDIMREMRAQGTSTGAAGGFTAPNEFIARVFEPLSDYGGIASISQILTTEVGNAIEWPVSDGTSEMGELIGENVEAAEGDVVFSMGILGVHKLGSKIIRVSNELLSDTSIDMDGFLANRIASRIGRAEAHYVVKGTGAGTPLQPKGLEASAAIGNTTAVATTFTWQEINALIHSIDPSYRRSPNFNLALNDTTLMAVENMEDDKKRPLWLPGIDAKAPATILGQPFVIDSGIANIAAGAKFMFAGDFSQLIIRRVKSLAIKRLVERYADFDQTGFLAFMRFGCVLQDLSAIKALRGKAA